MTGTAAELTPLREIDDQPVGEGRPGPVTKRDPERVRGRAARPRGALRPLAGRGARAGTRAVSRILIYDTTLRDGMQGEGMSLSAEEKVRVAHLLDDLGIPFIEAGFPASNPKEEELFERLAGERFAADVSRVRDDAPPRRARRGRPGAAAAAPRASRPSARSSARRGRCTSRRSCASTPRRTCAMIADSVAFLVGEGKRVIYDAEHFFDALARRPRLRAALRARRLRGRRART